MPKDSFDIASYPGLSDAEAERRLKAQGANELPSPDRKELSRIILEVLREPMFLLLIAGGTIYFCLGEKREALMLLGFVLVVMGITIYQERKTERALEALRDMASPRAMVIRGGRQKRIPGREVVPGDVVVVAEGDRVPADARLLHAVNVAADESMLTGESVPVRKQAVEADAAASRPGGDDLPFLYSGSLVVSGLGLAEVTAVGPATEMGKIGKALTVLQPEDTTLQKETRRIVKLFAAVGLAVCLLVVVMFSLTRNDWLSGMLAGIALAMSLLPEEFPVILTIFLALGAWRMSRHRVLVRRVPALEMLGAATVLCVDKTGTLTQNRMTVARLCSGGRSQDVGEGLRKLPEQFHELVEYAILASQRDPFDPMEKAIRALGSVRLAGTEHLHGDWELVHEYPLSRELLAMSHVWRALDNSEYLIAAKGAPEAITDLCHLPAGEASAVMRQVGAMAESGLRVLGVAKAAFSPAELPGGQHEFAFAFLGLVGLHDPMRPDVPAAIRDCYGAGLRPIMITGDYPGTARSIAAGIGLADPGRMVTGPELEAMDDGGFAKRLPAVSVFARAVPEQKLRIVNAFKAQGEIVAMTGDGVNDAPALKSAHIGISMGSRGTDVAREASSIVLLDDDFASIVRAIRVGRRIFENIRKALAYTIAVHVPIAGLSLLPVFFSGWPLILLPVHIVFLELIIDPACTIVFEMEPPEEDIMRRPPRDTSKPLFSRELAILSLLQGASVLAIVLGVLLAFLGRGYSFDDARTVAFSTLVVSNIALILTNRSWDHTVISILRRPNRAFWWILGGALLILGAAIYAPPLRSLFHFESLHARDLAVCLGAGMLGIAWLELLKIARRPPRGAGSVAAK